MKLVNPNNSTHAIRLIPRYTPSGVLKINIKGYEPVDCSYSVIDGILGLAFDFNFSDKERHSFSVTEANEVIYRGKIYVTDQESQNYKQTLGVYEY